MEMHTLIFFFWKSLDFAFYGYVILSEGTHFAKFEYYSKEIHLLIHSMLRVLKKNTPEI